MAKIQTENGQPAHYNATPPTLADGQASGLGVDVNQNLLGSMGTTIAGEDITNDVLKVEQRTLYLNGTASQLVKTGSGRFMGWVVNSHSSGTLKFWDAVTATAPILLNTITFAAGPASWVFPVAIQFSTGLFVTVGGTIDYTILYE